MRVELLASLRDFFLDVVEFFDEALNVVADSFYGPNRSVEFSFDFFHFREHLAEGTGLHLGLEPFLNPFDFFIVRDDLLFVVLLVEVVGVNGCVDLLSDFFIFIDFDLSHSLALIHELIDSSNFFLKFVRDFRSFLALLLQHLLVFQKEFVAVLKEGAADGLEHVHGLYRSRHLLLGLRNGGLVLRLFDLVRRKLLIDFADVSEGLSHQFVTHHLYVGCPYAGVVLHVILDLLRDFGVVLDFLFDLLLGFFVQLIVVVFIL